MSEPQSDAVMPSTWHTFVIGVLITGALGGFVASALTHHVSMSDALEVIIYRFFPLARTALVMDTR